MNEIFAQLSQYLGSFLETNGATNSFLQNSFSQVSGLDPGNIIAVLLFLALGAVACFLLLRLFILALKFSFAAAALYFILGIAAAGLPAINTIPNNQTSVPLSSPVPKQSFSSSNTQLLHSFADKASSIFSNSSFKQLSMNPNLVPAQNTNIGFLEMLSEETKISDIHLDSLSEKFEDAIDLFYEYELDLPFRKRTTK